MDEVFSGVEKATIQLMLKEPFYGHFFSNLVLKVVPADDRLVQTAAIVLYNNILSMQVNEKFWNTNVVVPDNREQTMKYGYGVIKHEVLHILFKHIFNHNHYSDKDCAAIAVDLVVNQYIAKDELPCIEHLAVLENFPEFFTGNEHLDQTVEYYYKILVEQRKEIEKILAETGDQSDNSQPQGQKGKGQKQQGSGSEDVEGNEERGDGDSDGKEDSDNNSDSDSDGQGPSDNPNLNKAQNQLNKFLRDNYAKEHETWKEISQGGAGTKEFTENWINEKIKDAIGACDRGPNKGKWRGTMPAGLLQYLDQLMESLKPSVNWKKLLRQFAQNGIRSWMRSTMKRRSKRFGTFPGLKVEQQARIMVAIDTSGSVDDRSLMEFFAEIKNIWKAGAEIHIVECDAQIGNTYNYKGITPEKITGRGGTDFNPPIEYANNEYKPDAVVYFTDGFCPAPIKCHCPLLWILAKNNSVDIDSIQDFQGIKVKMDF